jgi:tetratricopeptide (TPR) repeat protein
LTRTRALTVTLVLLSFAGLQSAFFFSDQAGGGDNVATRRFVQLSLLPESLGAIYREGLAPEVLHWIYPDEPVVVQLTLSNQRGESVDIPRQPREWFEAVRIQLVERAPDRKTEAASRSLARDLSGRVLQRYRNGSASLTAGVLRLGTGSSETVRLEFDRSQSSNVRPGIYSLSVSIDSRFAVADRAVQLLRRERLVGVRAIESRADVMNQAAHMAMWATMAKDFDAARRWLRELLAVNPGSFVAYTILGNVAEAQGRCNEAIANWEKALQIVTANSDTEAGEGRSSREDGISSLRLKIQRCQ